MNFQRDSLIEEIYNHAKKNKNIYFLSADFGAPALDKFRKNLKDQFIHTGISEQNTINVAAGLALKKKKVFVYAMAPFISLRCLEQHKCCSAIMNLPINTIVAGIGIGYADSGPTHYTTEDLASLRSLVGSNIFTASDTVTSKEIAKYLCKNDLFSFVRLDRDPQNNIYKKNQINSSILKKGYAKVKFNKTKNDYLILSHGKQFFRAHEIVKNNNSFKNKFDMIDIIRCKPFPKQLVKELKKYKKIIILDEQFISSSLYSIVGEINLIHNLNLKTIGFFLKDQYIFDNGGRENLLNKYGLNSQKIIDTLKKLK